MEIKIILLFIFFVGNEAIDSNTKNILSEVENNQALGMDCVTYSNSIDSLMNEYQQLYGSLNMVCQLHLKSAVGKFKSAVDFMVDQRIEEYLASVEVIKSKLIELQKMSFLQSVEKLHFKYQWDFQNLEANLTGEINEKNNLTKIIKMKDDLFNQSIAKCKDDMEVLEANFTKMYKKQNKIKLSSLIQSGSLQLAYEMFIELGGLDLKSIITSAYGKSVSHAEKVIEFLNLFSSDEEIIYGYRVLYEQMVKNQQIYSTPTTTIAYRVFVNYKYKLDENLTYLKANLPESVKNFQWGQVFDILNVKKQQHIYAHHHANYYHDSLRFHPMAYMKGSQLYTAMNIIPVTNGSYFYMQFKQCNFYVYAETNDFAVDSDRRAVFVWMKDSLTKEEGRWQLEPIPESQFFKIKNLHFNEYLSLADGVSIPASSSYSRLFTLRSGKCDDDFCKWDFEKRA